MINIIQYPHPFEESLLEREILTIQIAHTYVLCSWQGAEQTMFRTKSPFHIPNSKKIIKYFWMRHFF